MTAFTYGIISGYILCEWPIHLHHSRAIQSTMQSRLFRLLHYLLLRAHADVVVVGASAMTEFYESPMEYASFIYERSKVICYGLKNNAGGTVTVLNFVNNLLADQFKSDFLTDISFEVVHNQAQLLCLSDYDTVMRRSNSDPRVKYLHYNRDFMMGTLAHVGRF